MRHSLPGARHRPQSLHNSVSNESERSLSAQVLAQIRYCRACSKGVAQHQVVLSSAIKCLSRATET